MRDFPKSSFHRRNRGERTRRKSALLDYNIVNLFEFLRRRLCDRTGFPYTLSIDYLSMSKLFINLHAFIDKAVFYIVYCF